ncbi:GNAT family N-acetyltransferase, partial [Neobacillus vireti]
MSRLDRLKMGKVETNHFQQFNELLRYVFQVTKKDLQLVGWEEREIALAKKPVLDQADVIGWFDGEKLVSQLAVYPFQVNIFGQTFEMGGLTGVGTYPEYANMG